MFVIPEDNLPLPLLPALSLPFLLSFPKGIRFSASTRQITLLEAPVVGKLTMVLRYPSAKTTPEPGEQSITTAVVVFPEGRTGSCKTRMTSQVPVTAGGPGMQFSKDGIKFVELGTKFDCNNVHVEGDGLAFSIVLETSRITGMIETGGTNRDGTPTEEPIITQRNLELSVRLPSTSQR